jgi:DNA-binding NtrC family response regulator
VNACQRQARSIPWWRGALLESHNRSLHLVVDDEPGVRRLACQALQRGGYATIEAEDGAEALRILECATPPIGLVLSDIRMPRLDGVQLERTCRERWPGLPVLLMSGEVTRDWVVDWCVKTRTR